MWTVDPCDVPRPHELLITEVSYFNVDVTN